MDMNLTAVPAAYILFFVLILAAGLLGCSIRYRCFCLDKGDKVASSKTSGYSSSVTIVVEPVKPDRIYQSLNKPVRPVHVGRSQPDPAPVHRSDTKRNEYTSILFPCSSEPALVDMSIPRVASSLQRRSKIRRNGVYDALHTNKLSKTI